MTVHTPLEAFAQWVEKEPGRIFLRQPVNRVFNEYSFKQADDEIRRVATFLKKEGIPPGSHIAILSKNCAHWIMADLAIMMAGCISVPLYANLQPETIHEILTHSDAKAIIVGKLDDYANQKSGINEILTVGVECYGVNEAHSWESIVASHKPVDRSPVFDKDDLITIMYTSGTTGDPKGVMHSVEAFDTVVKCAMRKIHLPAFPNYFSYLPLSHIAERIGIEMSGIYRGACISFPESLESFAEDLASVQPDTFFGVPRIWQKFQEKVLEKMPAERLDFLLKIPLISSLLKKKIQTAMGLSKSVANFSGAAPISVSLKEWYNKLGIVVYQAYGMTEDCILSHFNLQDGNKFGTVGKPLPGVNSKISDEGEILIKSVCLTKGYYKQPERSEELFTSDGFLKTGDMGEFDKDGYLSITGRIKDQFKTDKGKYVSPAPIELEMLKNADVEQICVVGTGIPNPMALIVLSESGLKKSELDMKKSLTATIQAINPGLEKHEKIAKAVIMKEGWTVENGLMTPTLKVKRNKVESIHLPSYPQWFDQEGQVVFATA